MTKDNNPWNPRYIQSFKNSTPARLRRKYTGWGKKEEEEKKKKKKKKNRNHWMGAIF